MSTTDTGIKVARAGFSTATAADHQLLFSSSFKTLPIWMSGTIAPSVSVAHGLGYEPAFIAMFPETLSLSSGNYPGTELNNPDVYVDTTNITNNGGHSLTYYYYVFPIKLRSTVSPTIINNVAATQGTINQDYGIKGSTTGNDVKTAGLSNLSFFSGVTAANIPVRQAIVHQQFFTDSVSPGNSSSANHSLGYAPMFLAYLRTNGDTKYFCKFWVGSVVGGVLTFVTQWTSTTAAVVLTNTASSSTTYDVAAVILKDPTT